MKLSVRVAALLPVMLAAATSLLGTQLPSVAAATGQAQAPTDRLQVWNVNTHRMATDPAGCTNESPCTDYREFVDYITDPARVAYVPDIVTLQEAGTDISWLRTPSCHDFETVLEARTGRDYNCYETTEQGGAAIVYRTGRLSYVGGTLHKVRLQEISSTGACNLGDWYALVLRLRDDLTPSDYISVASVHLPTANYTTPDGNVNDCAWNNMKIIDSVADSLGSAAMRIMAGDWNHTDATTNSSGQFSFWECWYSGTNVDLGTCGGQNLGWKDAMYRACGLTGAAAYDCMSSQYWTTGGKNRIDFLFAKAYAIYNQDAVDYAEAYASAGSPSGWPAKYSDHRGEGALLRYY